MAWSLLGFAETEQAMWAGGVAYCPAATCSVVAWLTGINVCFPSLFNPFCIHNGLDSFKRMNGL